MTKFTPAGTALAYSTYLGGRVEDNANGIAVDGSGSAYVVGVTASPDFPTQTPVQARLRGLVDVFVTKLTPAGSSLVYSTFPGGIGITYGYGIAADARGSAYLTGYTDSPNFPTRLPFQPKLGGTYNAFVSKFSDR